MREVETQGVGADKRAFLLYVVAENLLQRMVEQVGGCMVCCTCLTLVGIDACHEVGIEVLWQFLDDVYALVVLTLGIDDGYRFGLADENTAVANLSAHLAIKWSGVEHKLVVCVFFLCHLSVAQYVTFVFGVVVAHEQLFALSQFYPVAVLHGCSVACTFLLLLHFLVELKSIDGKSVFTTDKLCEVKREAVGVEESECLHAVELCLACCLDTIDG